MNPLFKRLGRRISTNRTVRSAVRSIDPEIRKARSMFNTAGTRSQGVGSALSSAGEMLGRRKALTGIGIGVAAVSGFGSGFNSQAGDVSSSLYEMTTGNPNIDEDILGTNLSARELFAPIPGRLPRLGSVGSTMAGGGAGAVAGGVGGFALGSMLLRARGRGRVVAGLAGLATGSMGAAIGTAAGAGAGLAGSLNEQERRLVFNPSTIGRSMQDQRVQSQARRNAERYGNSMPMVDGSMVFGQYNFRGGS